MIYLAIKHKNTGRFVTGTDFNRWPRRQMMEVEYYPPLLFPNNDIGYDSLQIEIKRRKISLKRYEVVKVSLLEVKSE